VEQWAELRREHFVLGVCIKELVRQTGLSRNTIRAVLRSDAPPMFRCPERPSKLEPSRDEIHRLLKDDPKLSGVRVPSPTASATIRLFGPGQFVAGSPHASSSADAIAGEWAEGQSSARL
jgi:hypothetical protein